MRYFFGKLSNGWTMSSSAARLSLCRDENNVHRIQSEKYRVILCNAIKKTRKNFLKWEGWKMNRGSPFVSSMLILLYLAVEKLMRWLPLRMRKNHPSVYNGTTRAQMLHEATYFLGMCTRACPPPSFAVPARSSGHRREMVQRRTWMITLNIILDSAHSHRFQEENSLRELGGVLIWNTKQCYSCI